MLDYEYFCESLDGVSVSNFGVPAARLIKQKLFDFFVNEDKEILDVVMMEILKTNQSISYYNMYNKFEKYKNRKAAQTKEHKELKLVNGCVDKECHICDSDICKEVTEAFVKEWKNIDNRTESKEHKGAIERLKEKFPNLNWTYKKIVGMTIDKTDKRIPIYEEVTVI